MKKYTINKNTKPKCLKGGVLESMVKKESVNYCINYHSFIQRDCPYIRLIDGQQKCVYYDR